MQSKSDGGGSPMSERGDENAKQSEMIWTQIFYGREVMERIITTIGVKRSLASVFLLRYVLRATMAGFIVALMYYFALQVKVDALPLVGDGISHLLFAGAFSVALGFIFFTNSELLTSNFMYFTVGLYYRKVSFLDTGVIWSACLLGNLLGIIVISAALASTTMVDPRFVDYLAPVVAAKTVEADWWTLFVKAIFANYFINVSVIMAMQVKESITKLIMLCLGVIVFAYMGYEHVIANSALFILTFALAPESLDLAHVGKNFLCSLVGNYIGGGLVIGLFYAYLNDDRRHAAG